MKTFIYEYEEYEKHKGISYETEKNMVVKLSISDGECTLSANREGLIALAKSLIKLADENVPVGVHFHLDPVVFLEEDSTELIIDKIGASNDKSS